jgi:hypothetical protein
VHNVSPSTPECIQGLDFKSASTSALHIIRRKAKAPLVTSKVRRSERLKKKSSGFKTSACEARTYLCCDTEPPTLSERTIRSLGKDFCKMPTKMISKEALKRKSKEKVLVGPASGRVSKVDESTSKANEDKPKKKSRKG